MMGLNRYIFLFVCVVNSSALFAEEPFRTFTTVGGQSFTARALSYEGQTFYLEGKDKKLYPVPYNQVSATDKLYLRQISQEGKIPEGDPRLISAAEKKRGDRGYGLF